MMKDLIFIFIGSGLGGLTRYSLGKWINSLHEYHFPLGTLIINIIACFVLGFIIGLADHKQMMTATTRLFWAVGFCGGFSTFSTFSSETLTLLQEGHSTSLILYILSSVLLCVTATFVGLLIAERI